MKIKPIKTRFFVRLNLCLGLVFLLGFAIILYSVNPFTAKLFLLILFYVVLFGLLLVILNFISLVFKIPFWIRALIPICAILILIILSNGY